MPGETVTLQIGQCGNQVGLRFWELALRELAEHNTKGRCVCRVPPPPSSLLPAPPRPSHPAPACSRATIIHPEGGTRGLKCAPRFDQAISTFCRNLKCRGGDETEIKVGDGKNPIRTLKARAVLVDMEEGVIGEMLRGPMGDLFDARMRFGDVSGSGNNWAHGYHVYGPQYCEDFMERVRGATEACDSLQGFFMMHSLGGGTGSGFGSFAIERLADEYPEVLRFAASVFPSENDDVVTSPYNSVFSLNALAEHAECVLPLDNEALLAVCQRIEKQTRASPMRQGSSISGPVGGSSEKPYDRMNGIAANMLLNLTSSMRFESPLNLDLSDVTTNLVPFPRMHFLLSSMSPLGAPKGLGHAAGARMNAAIDKTFADAISPANQLLKADPRHNTYLACALQFRGPVTATDVDRNVRRWQKQLRMPHWNPDAFRVGLCAVPPAGLPHSCLVLANSCCFGQKLGAMRDRFSKLYRAKAFVNHYESNGLLPDEFREGLESLQALRDLYAHHDGPAAGA